MNSNWTLKFPRTSREAFGHPVQFEDDRDRLVGQVCVVLAAFTLGMMVGGVL